MTQAFQFDGEWRAIWHRDDHKTCRIATRRRFCKSALQVRWLSCSQNWSTGLTAVCRWTETNRYGRQFTIPASHKHWRSLESKGHKLKLSLCTCILPYTHHPKFKHGYFIIIIIIIIITIIVAVVVFVVHALFDRQYRLDTQFFYCLFKSENTPSLTATAGFKGPRLNVILAISRSLQLQTSAFLSIHDSHTLSMHRCRYP
jgi:hypothetical protein